MSILKSFADLESKKTLFSKTQYFQIDTKADFDKWFGFYDSALKQKRKTNFIYRGMGDASYKLYTSSQRLWIQNDMAQWAEKDYIDFVSDLVKMAKKYPLLKKVFDIYDYGEDERELPILSLLQHYQAPTPLMDWTYNINVALFFATESITGGKGTGKIGDYFSIYRINKQKYKDEFLSIRDVNYEHLPILSYKTFSAEGNAIFYLSDFEKGNTTGTKASSKIAVLPNIKPMTSIYNQNIIPQEGLFIFNPYPEKTIDDIFNTKAEEGPVNLLLEPFACFNIKKDLAEYVRRHIKQGHQIDQSFIYPKLSTDAEMIKNEILNKYATQ
jgi:hypothetical protein